MAARDRIDERFEDIEKAYKRVVEEIQQQMKELDDRFEKFLDNVQRQLPENAADLMQRSRKANREARRRLSEWAEQVQDAAQDFVSRDDKAAPASKASAKKAAAKKAAPSKAAAKKAAPKKAPAAKAAVDASSTKAEIMAEAKRLDVKGRSTMNKAQLLAAVRRAS